MAASCVTVVEAPGIGHAQPLHGLWQIGPLSSDQKVVVVVHQNIGKLYNIFISWAEQIFIEGSIMARALRITFPGKNTSAQN